MKKIIVTIIICLLVVGVFVALRFAPLFFYTAVINSSASQAEIDDQKVVDAFLSIKKANVVVPDKLDPIECSQTYQTRDTVTGKLSDVGEYTKYQTALIKREDFLNVDGRYLPPQIDICPSKYGDFVFLSYAKHLGSQSIMDVYLEGDTFKKIITLNADVLTPALFKDNNGDVFYRHEYFLYNYKELKNEKYQALFSYNPSEKTFELVYNNKVVPLSL